jgi:hypothetical protein
MFKYYSDLKEKETKVDLPANQHQNYLCLESPKVTTLVLFLL